MIELANSEELEQWLKVNISPLKRVLLGFLPDAIKVNEQLKENDVLTLRTTEFYDDLHELCIFKDHPRSTINELLDDHFLSHLDVRYIGSLFFLQSFYG
ncbi:hypothetical protein [Acinetobacter sp. P1(2025)]|uniref:hypothetical protein n=1 Tax=Acinetobacter sp. P1(2025) TaxID=3446120 RepID=UPI003F52B031